MARTLADRIPERVAEAATGFPARTPEYIPDRANRALETIAFMSGESTYRV